MDAHQVLTRARELLATKGWTQGCMARDKEGHAATMYPPARFCSLGATYYAFYAPGLSQGPTDWTPLYPALFTARERLVAHLPATFEPHARPWDRLIRWNDAPRRTKAEVLELFDAAIRTGGSFRGKTAVTVETASAISEEADLYADPADRDELDESP